MDKNFEVPKDPLAWIWLITQMEISPTPRESCIENSTRLGQSKVVDPPLYPREGDPQGFTW